MTKCSCRCFDRSRSMPDQSWPSAATAHRFPRQPALVSDRRAFRRSCGLRRSLRQRPRALVRQGGRNVDILKVSDAGDVEQVVRSAIASDQPLEIIGHGTKRGIGQPMATNAVLDLSALNAVKSYEPNELIITLQAGAPLHDVMSL